MMMLTKANTFQTNRAPRETRHVSTDGIKTLCGKTIANTPRYVWRQREQVEHLPRCKKCH